MNFVFLDKPPLNIFFYFLILVVEFLQQFFLVYYSVQCRDGFINPSTSQLPTDQYVAKLVESLNPQIFNISAEYQRTKAMLEKAQTLTILDNIFRMDELVKFANPILYALGSGKKKNFILCYYMSISIFFLIVIIWYYGGSKLFKIMKKGKGGDIYKISVWILSMLMIFFITVFQIPFLMLLIQGFKCGESSLTEYSISDLKCDDTEKQILIPLSSIMLIVYIFFLGIQSNLMHSNQYGSHMPWASFDRNLSLFRNLFKLVLTFTFIFDKGALIKPYIDLFTLALLLYILFRRYRDAIIFDKYIHILQTSLDIILAYHLLFVPLHQITNSRQSVSTVFIFLCNSIVIMGLYTVFQRMKTIRMMQSETFLEMSNSPNQCEVYLQKFYELVVRSAGSDTIIIEGKLNSHLEECKEKRCRCVRLAEEIDHLKKFNEFKRQLEIAKKQPQDQTNPYFKHLTTEFSQGFTLRVMGSQAIMDVENDENPQEMLRMGSSGAGLKSEMSMNFQSLRSNRANPQALDEALALTKYEEIIGQSLENEFEQGKEGTYEIRERVAELTSHRQVIYFKFLLLMLEQTANKYPKDAQIRLNVASLYKDHLKRYFKAYYELCKAQSQVVSLNQEFQLFRLFAQLESQIVFLHQQAQIVDKSVDVVKVIDYNKAFLSFQKNQVLASHSALLFWRQLLQRDFNAQQVQSLGYAIT
ncbi:hypothetical protein FGO68_gene11592 [Halteria grandinella]|uniref:Transmembrane protein n=1 Tax=Halteria grandinella TaxID=5974 RepID=A0A8J8TAM1_HALGN|nr:hypothetical protein FGO68_gene11592 [Halteria grandinella]